jgi:hypothetical protein
VAANYVVIPARKFAPCLWRPLLFAAELGLKRVASPPDRRSFAGLGRQQFSCRQLSGGRNEDVSRRAHLCLNARRIGLVRKRGRSIPSPFHFIERVTIPITA